MSSCTYLAIQQRHVLNPGVFNDVQFSWVLSNTAHTHTVRVVAPQVLDKDVGGVGFGREAIIADIDAGVGDRQAIDVVRIKSVGVFRESLCC